MGKNESEGFMKTLGEISKKMLKDLTPEKAILCDYLMTPWGPSLKKEPIKSDVHVCEYCQGKDHYCPYLDPKINDKRIWLCGNHLCAVYKTKETCKAAPTPSQRKRALEWPLFCEMNGIGDMHHGVKFEKIEQSTGKIDYLHKFANKPVGIIFMQGIPGTGKTYASMAVCEYFTRQCSSCIFITQKQMLGNWVEAIKSDKSNIFIQQLTNSNLLVVDDFGTGEIPPGFMGFFLDLINTRMQWSDRGTIISTNLSDEKFMSFCGEALCDRINTGQHFVFNEEKRRKQTIL